MKNLRNLGYMLTLLVATVFISCEDDGTGGGTGGGGTGGGDGFPVVSATGPGTSVIALGGDTLEYTITATAGSDELNAITVNGSNGVLSIDRIIVDGVGASNNPFTLSGDDRQSFTKVIGIIADKEDTDYSIVVTDAINQTVTTNFSINVALLPPSLDFKSMMSGSVNVEPGTLQNYPLVGTLGDGQLSTMRVLKDDADLGVSKIFWNGPNVTENPFMLQADQIDGFDDIDLSIRASDDEGTSQYLVILEDVNGNSDSLGFEIITEIVGTPVDATMGEFFNRSGQENGSFDFETNENVASSNTAADIRDQGNVSTTDGTWLKQLESANGATMKQVVAGMGGVSESFTFGGIVNKEELQGYFDGAQDYNNTEVSEGDVFSVVTADGLLVIFEIESIIDVTADNSDGYMINIKK